MGMKKLTVVCSTIGVSLALSGCLNTDQTTTVLEDGRIIQQIVLQPRYSLLTSVSAAHALVERTRRAPSASSKKHKLLDKLRSIGNACQMAEAFFDRKTYEQQNIPYSSTSIPLQYEFMGIKASKCSIQIGPYDPRKLPTGFLRDVLGMRVVSLNGLHNPYQVTTTDMGEKMRRKLSDPDVKILVSKVCATEGKPELCGRELRISVNLIDQFLNFRKGEEELEGLPDTDFEVMLRSNAGMLVGMAELVRAALSSGVATSRIPDNAAVRMARGAGDFTYGQGWTWRGSLMETVLAAPDFSLQVRPTRSPTFNPSSN